MYELKITIDQLKNYLGTGVKCEHPRTKSHYWKLSHDDMILNTISIKVALEIGAKPICYRLSDLDKFIPELGFVPLDEIAIYSPSQKDYLIDEILRGFVEHIIFDMIVKWNFWPFGDEYFNKGLVIDKMKYGKEASNE